MGKGNPGNQYLLLFSKRFFFFFPKLYQRKFNYLCRTVVVSYKYFRLGQILSSGNGSTFVTGPRLLRVNVCYGSTFVTGPRLLRVNVCYGLTFVTGPRFFE